MAASNTGKTLLSLQIQRRWSLLLILGLFGIAPLQAFSDVMIEVPHLPGESNVPVLDGNLDDWDSARFIDLEVQNTRQDSAISISSVRVAFLTIGDVLYAALQWPDETYDRQHKPYLWDEAQQHYVAGPQREDRLALQFEMEGDYDVDWLSGKEFTADMWHWKSARTAPLELLHDKITVVSTSSKLRAFKIANSSGQTIYIQRKSDSGSSIYASKRYGLKEKALMEKYIPNPDVSGSIADVKAVSRWQDGQWTLEIQRLMDTGHDDDVRFKRGASVRAGLAVFDRSGDDDHAVSDNLILNFE